MNKVGISSSGVLVFITVFSEYDNEELLNRNSPYWYELPSHTLEELKYFKRDYNLEKYFNKTLNRVNNKIIKYSEKSPHYLLNYLRKCGCLEQYDNDHIDILKSMAPELVEFETLTSYQILLNLGYNPFDGYSSDIKNKSFQQIILDHWANFVPWFNK